MKASNASQTNLLTAARTELQQTTNDLTKARESAAQFQVQSAELQQTVEQLRLQLSQATSQRDYQRVQRNLLQTEMKLSGDMSSLLTELLQEARWNRYLTLQALDVAQLVLTSVDNLSQFTRLTQCDEAAWKEVVVKQDARPLSAVQLRLAEIPATNDHPPPPDGELCRPLPAMPTCLSKNTLKSLYPEVTSYCGTSRFCFLL